jgi:hypothetical protein
MERVAGIEPAYSAWKADVLPLNYTRKKMVVGGGFEPPKLARQIYSLIPLATREPHHREQAVMPPYLTIGDHLFKLIYNRLKFNLRKFSFLIEKMELARGVEPPTG